MDWDDEDVLPEILSLDTEFVFRRMTVKTLQAVQPRKGLRILDVGCGRGIDAVSLAQEGAILFGCEPSRIMLRRAKEWTIRSGEKVMLVRGLAESLPFRNQVFAGVVCKGAIDHFAEPDLALSEMCRVADRRGKVTISVANFESLSCALARKVNVVFQRCFGREIPRPHIWEVPADHSFKFDYSSITALARRYLQLESLQGTSLFWGFPRWSTLLRVFPRGLALSFLRIFDRIASRHPPWGDVLILCGKPQRNLEERERSTTNG